MVEWTAEQQQVLAAFESNTLKELELPEKYKCTVCHKVLYAHDVEQVSGHPACKNCKTPVLPMCPLDHVHCSHEVVSGLAYCPICGKAMCPECGSHDVTQVSRVTGYLADVSGWNNGKAQELKDRVRNNIVGSEAVLVKPQ